MRHLNALPLSLLTLFTTFTAAADLEITTTHHTSCTRPSRDGDTIAVHYRGTLQSTGAEFDESYKRGAPFEFRLGAGQVIAGWDQGLLDMCPGEDRTLIIPPDLAYGAWGAPPAIPGGATLVFETKLVEIVGVVQESVDIEEGEKEEATETEEAFSIATAPSTPPLEDMKGEEDAELVATPLESAAPANPMTVQEGECHLLGPFALIVQGALGAVALLSLVFKRWREESKRPWKIWFFDVSKQVVGSMLTHVLNLAMSMLGSVDMVNAAKSAAAKVDANASEGGGRRSPNPCSFYLLNLAIDTTLGIPILYLLLKVLHVAFSYTPLARPKESIKSGHYGRPPRYSWWLKQALIYFIGLTGMKMFVWSLFALLPWLPWVGDWALRWTEGNEALQIAFAMFVFPLAMNAVQYWIIDNFIMEKTKKKSDGGDGGGEYSQVQQSGGDDYEDVGEDETLHSESVRGKGEDADDVVPPLAEINPTPIPDRVDDDAKKAQSSRNATPPGEGR